MPQRISSLRYATLPSQWCILLIRVKGMWQIFLSSLTRGLRRNDCVEPRKSESVKLRKKNGHAKPKQNDSARLRKSKLARRKMSGCVEPRKSESVKQKKKNGHAKPKQNDSA